MQEITHHSWRLGVSRRHGSRYPQAWMPTWILDQITVRTCIADILPSTYLLLCPGPTDRSRFLQTSTGNRLLATCNKANTMCPFCRKASITCLPDRAQTCLHMLEETCITHLAITPPVYMDREKPTMILDISKRCEMIERGTNQVGKIRDIQVDARNIETPDMQGIRQDARTLATNNQAWTTQDSRP